MGLSAYEIALISGGFGIVGTLLGVLITYHFATKLANTNAALTARQAEVNALREGSAKFRAAFAPALGQIYLARTHGDHNRPSIDDFVKSNLLSHAAAIEEFRPFVPSNDSAVYQETWETYRKFANEDCAALGEDWASDLPEGKTLEACIHAILRFAKT